MKRETPVNAKNTKTFGIVRDSEIAKVLANIKSVIDRTNLIEKWYLAYKKEQG